MVEAIIIIGGVAITAVVFYNIFKKKDKKEVVLPPVIFPNPDLTETPVDIEPTPSETNTIELPVEPDPEPTPEMPIKPIPVNCQQAIFRPAPETFSYFDCCGNLFQGEGYQPWEKRSPVSIDINKEFSGMDLTGEESYQDC